MLLPGCNLLLQSPIIVTTAATAHSSFSALHEQINQIIEQEEDDDMAPSALPLQEENEARSGYTASLNILPDGLFFQNTSCR